MSNRSSVFSVIETDYPDVARIRTISLIFTLALAAAVTVGRTAAAQEVDAWPTTDSVTVGDRFGLVVAVGHDGGRTVLFPHELRPDSLARTAAFGLGDFEVLDIRSRGSRAFSGGGIIDSVVYETTTFALDTARVAGVPVGLVGPVDTLTLAADAVMLPVTSLVPADAEDVRDLKPLAEFPRVWWPWIVGLMALAGVAGALWYYRRKQLETADVEEDTEPPVPPYEQAMQRLHELERLDVELSDNVKPYYVEISDVLRTYLGRRVSVKALESTTRELLDSLEDRTVERGVPERVVDEAREILDQADLVKFADARPVWEKNRRVMTLTKSTIETTERALREREAELVRATARPPAGAGGDGANGSERATAGPAPGSSSIESSGDSRPSDPFAPPGSR